MTLYISGWRYGFEKIGCTRLLQKELGYSLAAAKKVTDRILEDEQVMLDVDDSIGDRLASALNALGAACEVLAVPQHA